MKRTEPNGIKEIARRAGVSIGTVDRVLHERQGVSEKTKNKIQAIIKELDYHPNKMASLLASKKQLNFAVIIPMVSANTDYWDYPKKGIDLAGQELKQLGVSIQYFLFNLDDKHSFNKACSEAFATKPDGIILAPSFIKESTVFVEKTTAKSIPVIYINSDLPHNPGISYIGPDFFQSGRVAAQLTNLYTRPQDTVMVINISTDMESDHHLLRKVQGFEKYFEELGSTRKVLTIHIPQTGVLNIEKIVKKALSTHVNCRTFFVTNSRVHILAGILQKQLEDYFLIGYDFIEKNIAHLKSDKIAFLICQRPKDQGYQAVMAMYKYLYYGTLPKEILYMPIDIITKENNMYYGF